MRTRVFTEETKTAAIRENSVDAFRIIDVRARKFADTYITQIKILKAYRAGGLGIIQLAAMMMNEEGLVGWIRLKNVMVQYI